MESEEPAPVIEVGEITHDADLNVTLTDVEGNPVEITPGEVHQDTAGNVLVGAPGPVESPPPSPGNVTIEGDSGSFQEDES